MRFMEIVVCLPFASIFAIFFTINCFGSRENNLGMIGKSETHICFYMALFVSFGPRQANLLLIAYASSEGSGEPAHPRSLARTSAARS